MRILYSLAILLALTLLRTAAQDAEPEPPSKTKDEVATPAVNLTLAKDDAKLAKLMRTQQMTSQNNLRQLAIGVHSYSDAMAVLPNDITNKAGTPLLSWRVAILPYLEQDKLYKEFKLDEPWDSKHNLKLLDKMPAVFNSPRVKLKIKSNTVYQAFTGKEAVFGRGGRPLGLAAIPDGTSNTIMFVETSTGVPWTKPGGIPFDRTKDLPDFGKAYGKKPLAALFDGSTRVLDLSKIRAETLKNAIDPADGNVLGADW